MIYPTSPELIDRYKQLSSDLGFFCQELSNGYSKFPLLILAALESDLKELVASLTEFFKHPPATAFLPQLDRKIGQLVGYPSSAIDYYIDRLGKYYQTGELSDFVELSGEYQSYLPFVEFILSPDNYQAEIASYVEPLRQVTKAYAPELYDRLVKSYRPQDGWYQ